VSASPSYVSSYEETEKLKLAIRKQELTIASLQNQLYQKVRSRTHELPVH